MNKHHQAQSRIGLRLAVGVGVACIATATVMSVVTVISWSAHGDDENLFHANSALSLLATLSLAFLCGLFLLRHRPSFGETLMLLAIGLFILGLTAPGLWER